MSESDKQKERMTAEFDKALAAQSAANTSEVSRADRARELLPANTAERFKQIMALTDAKVDATDPDWLNILGLAYYQPSTAHYNLKKAHAYFTKAANIGHGLAAYNLAKGWQDGRFGKIDLERARYWFAKGFEYGHGCAGGVLAEMMFQDPRMESDKQFASAAHEVLRQSDKLEALWPYYIVAAMNINSDNYDLWGSGIDRYKLLASLPLDVPPVAYARMSLALRYYLGLGTVRDYGKALHYLKNTDVSNQQSNVRYGLQNNKDRLRFIIQGEKQDGNTNYRSQRVIEHYDYILQTADQKWVYDQFVKEMQTSVYPTANLADHLWARSLLAEMERSKLAWCWEAAAFAIQHRLMGATHGQIQNSTRDFGYTYGGQDRAGYLTPQLGNQVASRPDAQSRSENYQHCPRLEDGALGILRGLSTTPSGEIQFHADKPTSPANTFLTDEDIAVALALAFGSNKPIMPSLSIESIGLKDAKTPRVFMKKKVWDPEWVGHTQLGKTLYAADFWMAEIVWNQPYFYQNGQQPPAAIDAILQKVALAGGHSDGNSERIMLMPTAIVRTWSGSNEEGISCQVHSASVGVLGANKVIHADGSEDRSRNVNDDKYGAGRAANIVSRHFDDIATAWPMFERMRQLTVLLSLLKELREKNFQPSVAMQKNISVAYRHLSNKPRIPVNQALVYQL